MPSAREAAHDFLWRVHRATPMQDEISIFNRSHYEDVLVARVHELVAPKIWKARYEHINNFEKLLTDNRTIVLKFYLHISKEEQEKRLLAREQDATKAWKLNIGDWQERSRWDDYQRAYEDALSQCSTSYAPWSIVPADHKWYRNLAVAHAIISALRPLKKGWLELLPDESKERLAELEKFRAEGGANGGKPEP